MPYRTVRCYGNERREDEPVRRDGREFVSRRAEPAELRSIRPKRNPELLGLRKHLYASGPYVLFNVGAQLSEPLIYHRRAERRRVERPGGGGPRRHSRND